jgi:hypothetical protein
MKKFSFKLSSATVHDGEIKGPGTVVSVSEREAKNLLRRGKGELLTAPAGEAADVYLSKLTVDALRDMATDLGITNVRDLKKADLILAIEDVQAGDFSEGGDA